MVHRKNFNRAKKWAVEESGKKWSEMTSSERREWMDDFDEEEEE